MLGLDPSSDGSTVRSRCGVVPPKPAMYERLSGRENLGYAADLYGVGRDGIESAAGRFGIATALDQTVGGYSTGMRTRLALARAFLHDPDVLLLDEPTAGLDPESARDVLALISELSTTGRTIVMCTHLLHEAEGIADQVALMVRGAARVAGHPTELAERYFSQPRVVIDAEDRGSLRGIAARPEVVAAEWNGGLEVALTSLRELPDLVAALYLEDPPWSAPPHAGPDPTAGPRTAEYREWILGLRSSDQSDRSAWCKENNPGWPEDEYGPWATSKAQVDPLVFDRPLDPKRYGWNLIVDQVTCPVHLIVGDPVFGSTADPETVADLRQRSNWVITQCWGIGHDVRRLARARAQAVLFETIAAVG